MRNTVALDDGIISGQYHLRQLCVYLENRQQDVPTMLAACGIPCNILEDKSARISYQQYRQALLYGQKCLHDPAFGLHLGRAFTDDSHGLIGLSAQCSANLLDALTTVVEFKKVFSPVTSLAFKRAGNYCYLECNMALTWDDEPTTRLLMETCFAYLFKAMVQLLPELKELTLFEFSYESPDCVEEYYCYLNNNIHFNGVKNRMIIPASFLESVLPSANRWLVEEAEAIKLQALHHQEPRDGLITLITSLLREESHAVSTQEQLASALNTSISALKRRLNKHHCSFQCLWDDVRKHKACEIIENQNATIAEIADQMHFSDVASFRKSFKRWTGDSPQSYRQNIQSWLVASDDHVLLSVNKDSQGPPARIH